MRAGAPPLPAHAVKEPTLLGEAFDADGSINAAGVDRVVEAVDRAVRAAWRLGVGQLYVFVTAAIRDAANRELIVARVERQAGVRPQILTGPGPVPGHAHEDIPPRVQERVPAR